MTNDGEESREAPREMRGSRLAPSVIAVTDFFASAWEHIGGRLSGPLHLRFILQPVAAAIVAVRSCRESPLEYRAVWADIGIVWTMAFVFDGAYQLVVLHWFYLWESVLIASFLALLPYLVVRQSMARLARRRRRS